MTLNNWEGICPVCFTPIFLGNGATIRAHGRHFHMTCLHNNPNNYYVKLERSLAKREATLACKRAAMNALEQDCCTEPIYFIGTSFDVCDFDDLFDVP